MGTIVVNNELVDTDKARELLGIGKRQFAHLVKNGRLRQINFGYKQVYYKRTDVFWLLHELVDERRGKDANISV